MRRKLSSRVERDRITSGDYGTEPGSGPQGKFYLSGPLGTRLCVVASDARDWDECGLPEPRWEHVSVSTERRCPTWKEMEFVRDCFFEPDETVLQFSVPRAAHLNHHPYCLHLWRPIGIEIPMPPPITVAPKDAEEARRCGY